MTKKKKKAFRTYKKPFIKFILGKRYEGRFFNTIIKVQNSLQIFQLLPTTVESKRRICSLHPREIFMHYSSTVSSSKFLM